MVTPIEAAADEIMSQGLFDGGMWNAGDDVRAAQSVVAAYLKATRAETGFPIFDEYLDAMIAELEEG